MIIKKFCAENFRNIKKCEIDFREGINILIGDNAQGKTNTAEGIYIFSRGRSQRTSDDDELIKFGEEGFRISVEYEDKNGTNTLEYARFGKDKRRKKNGYSVNKITEFVGNLRAVLFTPDDLSLVKGGPEERRSFLNIAISQHDPSYINLYSSYKKALENRNHILKQASKGFYYDENELRSWSNSLAEYASYIYLQRYSYIEKLKKYTSLIMKDISEEKEEINIEYISDIEEFCEKRELIKKKYEEIFSSSEEREKAAGLTLFGPHRDDIKIEINGSLARSYSSQGQQRSVVLSMKLSEGEIIKEKIGEYPIYIFDDVLSELDEGRQRYVLSGREGMQLIITACKMSDIISEGVNIIKVEGGFYN